MSSKITVYIPCYIQDDKRFYNRLWKTLYSIKKYPEFWKIKLFICQKDKKLSLKQRSDQYNNISIIYLKEYSPMYFPMDVFNYMKNDKDLGDDDYQFYMEWDHILYINDDFLDKVLKELDKWMCVMPHRLWKVKAEKREYIKYNWYYVWNYAKSCIKQYNKNFDIIIPINWISNKIFWTYAWCYFIKKGTLKRVENICIKRWKTMQNFHIKIFGYFHYFWLLKRYGIPYNLKLETPSLILPLRNIMILKSHKIQELYVIHLSWSWYV